MRTDAFGKTRGCHCFITVHSHAGSPPFVLTKHYVSIPAWTALLLPLHRQLFRRITSINMHRSPIIALLLAFASTGVIAADDLVITSCYSKDSHCETTKKPALDTCIQITEASKRGDTGSFFGVCFRSVSLVFVS